MHSYATKSPHTANTLYRYTHLPPLSCTHATPEYKTASTTGDNPTDTGNQSSHPNAPVSISTKHTRLTCITATLPSLYSLWFLNTTSFSTPAKALSFPLPNSFAETSSQQFRGGTMPTEKNTIATSFIEQQIQLHEHHLGNRLNIHVVCNARRSIPSGIFHSEDHLPNKLMWYCPHLYHTAITNTFLDKKSLPCSRSPSFASSFQHLHPHTTLTPPLQMVHARMGQDSNRKKFCPRGKSPLRKDVQSCHSLEPCFAHSPAISLM